MHRYQNQSTCEIAPYRHRLFFHCTDKGACNRLAMYTLIHYIFRGVWRRPPSWFGRYHPYFQASVKKIQKLAKPFLVVCNTEIHVTCFIHKQCSGNARRPRKHKNLEVIIMQTPARNDKQNPQRLINSNLYHTNAFFLAKFFSLPCRRVFHFLIFYQQRS